jgi:flagellar biosynthesis regulator FlaF
MSILYSADDFDDDGNFVSARCFQDLLTENEGLAGQVPSFNNISWDDPALYMIPLTSDEIAAVMSDNPKLPAPTPVTPTSDIAATNPFPELPDPSSHQPSKTHSLSPAPSPKSSAPLCKANSSSWTAWNPTQSIICPQTPPPQLTDAQKASQKIKRDQKIEKMKCLHDTVTEYLDEQKMKIEALLWAHHVTPKQINDIIGSQTHYRTSRKSQLIHALIHAKAKEINAGKSNDFYSMVSQSLSCIN